MAPQWNHLEKQFHFVKVEPLCKVVLKQYLNGGHPVDMKTAPLWSQFSSTFFFQFSFSENQLALKCKLICKTLQTAYKVLFLRKPF